ncbi:MAG: restriction endonuclease subunit S [Acidobacteriota bacterium]|jgi:type I restriction enzyme S subunit|nr:restriction endonuclease subunit S [Acidobacteriota bacterium]
MGIDWEQEKLGAVATVRSGFAFKSKDMGSIGYAIIKIKNIVPPNVNINDVERVPFDLINGNKRVGQFLLSTGDILIAMTGATVGKVGRMPETSENYYLNQRVGKVFLKDTNRADYDFLYYVLSQETHVKQMFGIADGSAQANISGGHIESLDIPLPPLPEQLAIAHILGTLDDKIELNRRMNETLEAMARALFKSWFVDFDPVIDNALRAGNPIPEELKEKAARRKQILQSGQYPPLPPEIATLFPDRFVDSELGVGPMGWEVRTIGDVAEFSYGKALKASDRKPGDVPVFGSNGQVGLHNEALVKGPGIVIGRKGNPGIVTWSYDDFFPIDTTFYVKRTEIVASLNYLFYALKAQDLPSLSADSAVPGLNRNLAYIGKILVPHEEVLTAFDGQLDPLFKKIYENEKETKTLSSFRDTLLPKLISGELRVTDAEKFIEEALI